MMTFADPELVDQEEAVLPQVGGEYGAGQFGNELVLE